MSGDLLMAFSSGTASRAGLNDRRIAEGRDDRKAESDRVWGGRISLHRANIVILCSVVLIGAIFEGTLEQRRTRPTAPPFEGALVLLGLGGCSSTSTMARRRGAARPLHRRDDLHPYGKEAKGKANSRSGAKGEITIFLFASRAWFAHVLGTFLRGRT